MFEEDQELVYRAAIYEAELPAGIARFRIGDSVRSRPFALITAYNPGRARPGAEENARANERLRAAITAAGHEFAPGCGKSPDATHTEPSFAVFGIAFEAALRLATEFGQAAFVWFDGETTTLASTDERVDGGAT